MLNEQFHTRLKKQIHLTHLIKWAVIACLVGLGSGLASAFFLHALKWATEFRNENSWLLALLPLGGLVVAATYVWWGKSVEKGNNQLIEEVQEPNKIIPFIMAPLVLFGTVITHLFGGSAGREGTAVQMGGSIADQLTKPFKLSYEERRILIMCGIAGGFSSVFGTPLAGAVFALEIIFIGKVRYDAIVATIITAIVANMACHYVGPPHTQYAITEVPEMDFLNLGLVIVSAICFGWAAIMFSSGMHWFSKQFKTYIKSPFLRPVVGGAIVAVLGYFMGAKYLGLGVPTIVESFTIQQGAEVFVLKLALTVITLGAGFKGGEVTPLFYVGATLGSALSLFLPLPVSLLAGVGFVAVFSGATNAPIACSLMGIELFGSEAAVYIVLGCFIAYYFSGHTGIYSSQIIGRPKHPFLSGLKGKRLSEL